MLRGAANSERTIALNEKVVVARQGRLCVIIAGIIERVLGAVGNYQDDTSIAGQIHGLACGIVQMDIV